MSRFNGFPHGGANRLARASRRAGTGASFNPVKGAWGVIPSTLKYFQLEAEKAAVTESTPFYFPWLVHDEASKFAPK